MERDDKRIINRLTRSLSVVWLAGMSFLVLRLFYTIFEKYPIFGSLLSCGWVIAAVLAICHVFDQTRNESSEIVMEQDAENNNCEQSPVTKIVIPLSCVMMSCVFMALTDDSIITFLCFGIMGAAIVFFLRFAPKSKENSDAEETNQNTETENGASLSVTNAVNPIVKASAKVNAVAPYQNKMDRLEKQYKDYDTELRNLGTETTNYRKCMDAIQNELDRQCEYVARIAEIERKQTDITDNPKAAEISKKVRDSYKAKRKEAESNIASLIDRAEQVVVLMQQDLENHIYDAKAQVETGKIDDMLSKLENSVQLDQEINGKAAKMCLELKGIDKKLEG